MSIIKVLMADDEPDICEVMSRKIRAAGYDVQVACDGQEAWDKIVSEDPDVIVLDLTMPRLSGLTVLKRLRETPPSSKWQPVIIVSAHGELSQIKEGLALQADHYLVKPCQIEDVLKAIRLMVSLIPLRKTPDELN